MDTSSKLLVSQATYQEEDELRGTVSEGEAKGKSHSNPNPTWIREMGTSCLVTDDSNLLLSKSPNRANNFRKRKITHENSRKSPKNTFLDNPRKIPNKNNPNKKSADRKTALGRGRVTSQCGSFRALDRLVSRFR